LRGSSASWGPFLFYGQTNLRIGASKYAEMLLRFIRRTGEIVAMIQIIRIPVPKERLRALSKDERVLLLLLGYAANQIMMMEKLLIFSANKEPTELVQHQVTGVQTQMILRLTIGVLNEAWQVIATRFNQKSLNVEYRPLLDEKGQKALLELKQQFGSSNLLNRIRTHYAFHHPESDDVERAFDAAINNSGLDDDWNFYLPQHGFNSMFLISDIVIVHGIFEELGENDWEAGQQKIMDEVTKAADNINEFAKAFTAAVWRKHFGQEMVSDKVVEIHDAPNVEEVVLPFFVAIPGEKSFDKNAFLAARR
jgi:hypothetical protein